MIRADWQSRTAVVIGSGPSLDDAQLVDVWRARANDRCRVIAVNNTCQRAPWADVVYFGDYLALREYLPRLRPICRGEWWTASKAGAERWQLHYVRSSGRPGLGDGDRIHLNGNSGMQALNLAALFGARRIVLLGFDMRLGAGGRKHWFGDHPAPLVQEVLFDEWKHKAAAIAVDAADRRIEVLNATPGSALEAFLRVDLEEALR